MKKTKEKVIVEGVEVVNYVMMQHISMNKLHVLMCSGEFLCEGKQLHKKEFRHETATPIRGFMHYGRPKQSFYLNEPNSPIFKTLKELVKFYNK